MLRCRIGLKYIPVIRNGHFYCSFETSSTRTIILVCKTLHNIEFWLRKKILKFVSSDSVSLKQSAKKSQVDQKKWIQVASTYLPLRPGDKKQLKSQDVTS